MKRFDVQSFAWVSQRKMLPVMLQSLCKSFSRAYCSCSQIELRQAVWERLEALQDNSVWPGTIEPWYL